jgi:hypothetical protein
MLGAMGRWNPGFSEKLHKIQIFEPNPAGA